jgi:predicted Co/Zn/Cd cation transporter (cation efflux family)
MNHYRLEQVGLYLSVAVTLFMSILGISFGVWIESDAILLDGFFNVISLLMAGATLWVAWLQQQPESSHFQFGYLGFVPLVNVIKGVLFFTLSLFALFSALAALLHGGRYLNANSAILYASIAAFGCLITALVQRKMAHQTRSAMLEVDAKNWFINGLISLSVGVAFGLVSLMKDTPFSGFIPYADPTIVTVLVLITLPVPCQIVLQNANQLLLGAPDATVQKEIKNVI